MANGLYGTQRPDPKLNQTALRPAAIPSSTFVRAQDDGANMGAARDLNELAKALGMLNSSVNQYADVRESVRQDPNTKENKEWVAKRSQMSYDDLRKEAEKGTPDGIRVREDAVNSLLGDKAYNQFRSEWAEFYNTDFDRMGGNLEEAYEQKRQEFAANLPDDVSRGRFYNLTQNHLANWMDENTKERVEYASEQIQTAALDSFRNTIADGKAAGKTPEEIAKAVFESSAGNRSFLKFSGQQQNETLFQIAKEAAQNGDVDLVKSLLDMSRVGANGEKIPSLRQTASYASKAIALIEGAQNSKLNKNTKENTQAYMALNEKVANGSLSDEDAIGAQDSGLWTSQQAASARQQAKNNLARAQATYKKEQDKFIAKQTSQRAQDDVVATTVNALDEVSGATYIGDAEIPNESGTGTTTITREKRIKMATVEKEKQFDQYTQELINAGQTPEEAKKNADKVRLAWYSNNNIENTTWTDVFNGVASRMTSETLTKNPETTKVLTQQLETYRNLKQNNPAYLDKFVTDKKSKEFLEYFDNAVTYSQLPEQDAALAAANWVAKDELSKSKSILKTEKTDSITKGIMSDLSLDRDTAINASLVRNMVETQSKLGVPEGRIKELVSKQLKDTTVEINGVMVKKTKDLPEDFGPLMLQSLDDIAERLPEARGEVSSSDMIVISSPNEGMWSVHQKSNPSRILAVITPENLENIRKANIKELMTHTKEEYEEDKASTDALVSAMPSLEERRTTYSKVLDDRAARYRSQSKEAGDYWDRMATSVEREKSRWIRADNASYKRNNKLINKVTQGVGAFVKGRQDFTKSLGTPVPEAPKKQKSKGIVGLYNETFGDDK